MLLEKQEMDLNEIEQEEVVVTTKKTSRRKAAAKAVVAEETRSLDELIPIWKSEHKKLFRNEVDGQTVIWRRIKRGEYKDILKAESEDEDSRILGKQELITRVSVLYPFNLDELIEENAGLATVLSEEILAKSGFAISYTEEL